MLILHNCVVLKALSVGFSSCLKKIAKCKCYKIVLLSYRFCLNKKPLTLEQTVTEYFRDQDRKYDNENQAHTQTHYGTYCRQQDYNRNCLCKPSTPENHESEIYDDKARGI